MSIIYRDYIYLDIGILKVLESLKIISFNCSEQQQLETIIAAKCLEEGDLVTKPFISLGDSSLRALPQLCHWIFCGVFGASE